MKEDVSSDIAQCTDVLEEPTASIIRAMTAIFFKRWSTVIL